ncbi:hypothetical protein KA107_02065 [Candidatus Pacearchaeota archaeon]|nr:hypothetical protein [Candidatus Pacearchaeota archaeon]
MVKTFVISAAQGIQSRKHAEKYGSDPNKGEPCKPLIQNIDQYSSDHNAQTVICAVQGMDTEEAELDESLEMRKDIYIDKNRLQRLECKNRAEGEKILGKIEKIQTRIDGIERRVAEVEEEVTGKKEARKLRELGSCIEELTEVRDELEARLADFDGATEAYTPLDVMALNKKAIIADLIVPSQNKDPMTGMLEVAQSKLEKTIIFPHTKQRLKVAPKNMNGKFPRLMLTTGAITHPNYNTTNTRGDQADRMHQYGFCVVDVIDEKLFLPRIVPANASGTFVDMGIRYEQGKKPVKAKIEALVLGDLHNAQIDETIMRANYEMIEFFDPKAVYIHDIFDGQSVTPHKRGMALTRLLDYEAGRTSVENEVEKTYRRALEISKAVGKGKKVRIVLSNHDDMLKRWLEAERFQEEIENKSFGGKLFYSLREGEWPLKKAMEMMGKIPANVEFLSLKSDIRPWGYQLAAHGHKGVNGSKGSLLSLKRGFGKVIMGHVHQPEINGYAISVGTSTEIPLDYQEGQPGTSMAANAVLAEGGFAQLLPIIYGKWKAD